MDAAGGVDGRRATTAIAMSADASGTAIHASRQLTSPKSPHKGMPTTQASGGPRSATASTGERFSGVVHSATAAIAAEYESPTPIPTSS